MARQMVLQTLITRALELRGDGGGITLTYAEHSGSQLAPTRTSILLTADQAATLRDHLTELLGLPAGAARQAEVDAQRQRTA